MKDGYNKLYTKVSFHSQRHAALTHKMSSQTNKKYVMEKIKLERKRKKAKIHHQLQII